MVDAAPVKPALVKKRNNDKKSSSSPHRKKKDLKWDEAKIEEHDKLRGTRMKIDEPNTPFAHYDSGSDTDGSHNAASKEAGELSWDHLQNKLESVAAVRDAYPSSPSSHDAVHDDQLHNSDAEDEHQKEIKAMEFKEHRKRHYNEMELVRKYREENVDEDEGDNDADDENENDRKPSASS